MPKINKERKIKKYINISNRRKKIKGGIPDKIFQETELTYENYKTISKYYMEYKKERDSNKQIKNFFDKEEIKTLLSIENEDTDDIITKRIKNFINQYDEIVVKKDFPNYKDILTENSGSPIPTPDTSNEHIKGRKIEYENYYDNIRHLCLKILRIILKNENIDNIEKHYEQLYIILLFLTIKKDEKDEKEVCEKLRSVDFNLLQKICKKFNDDKSKNPEGSYTYGNTPVVFTSSTFPKFFTDDFLYKFYKDTPKSFGAKNIGRKKLNQDLYRLRENGNDNFKITTDKKAIINCILIELCLIQTLSAFKLLKLVSLDEYSPLKLQDFFDKYSLIKKYIVLDNKKLKLTNINKTEVEMLTSGTTSFNKPDDVEKLNEFLTAISDSILTF